MNENQNAQNNQANIKEAKTVVNGKVVSLKQAEEAAQQADKLQNKTGIQEHHNNNSEAVKAGETALGSQQVQKTEFRVNHSNIQSGQSHVENHMNQSQQQSGTLYQQAAEQQAKAKAAAKTNKKAD